MEGLDKRAPFTATGGIIPPEFRNIKTPCYILDEKALIKNAKLLGEVAERTGCKMLLAQKAFSNYDCYQFFEPYLAGTEASGLFEAIFRYYLDVVIFLIKFLYQIVYDQTSLGF